MVLNSRADAERFEHLLVQYGKARTNEASIPVPIAKAFDVLQPHPEKTRVIAALQDIAMTHLEYFADDLLAHEPWMRFGLREPGNSSSEELHFVRQMDAHRFLTAAESTLVQGEIQWPD